MPYGIAQCHLGVVIFPFLPQPKLVLDLAIPKGCETVLTWAAVIFQDSLPAKDGHPTHLSHK